MIAPETELAGGPDAGVSAVRVAFQGDHGAFSEEAARALVGDRPSTTLPMHDFAGVGDAVKNGTADCGVLPVENSIHGSVIAAYDVLGGGGLAVVAERVQPIGLCLLGVPGSTLEGIRRVISHPVALAQCGRFLGSLAGARVDAWYDTAGAAREVATSGDAAVAAVAGQHAAEVYGLTVLSAAIQDRGDNATRFFLVVAADAGSAMSAPDDGPHRAVVVLETDHRPGALVRVLQPFAERGVNLTRIESRPADERWRYRFFIELASDDGATAIHAAVEAVRPHTRRLDVIGCFKAERGV